MQQLFIILYHILFNALYNKMSLLVDNCSEYPKSKLKSGRFQEIRLKGKSPFGNPPADTWRLPTLKERRVCLSCAFLCKTGGFSLVRTNADYTDLYFAVTPQTLPIYPYIIDYNCPGGNFGTLFCFKTTRTPPIIGKDRPREDCPPEV
jgi:hypothetical protein